MTKTEIFKIQQSLFDSEGRKRMLVYNEDRSLTYEDDLTPEIQKLLKYKPKKYFYGKYNPKTTKIEIEREAPFQNW